MKIGFDMDNVFVGIPFFVPYSLIDLFYKGQSKDKLSYRFPGKLEKKIRIISHYPFFRPSIGKNIEFIKSIPKKTNTFYLISSRFGFLKKRTDLIVKKYELSEYFEDMFFNYNNQQPHVFKNEILKKLKLDKYVDDDLALVKYLAVENPKTTFYWLNKNTSKQISKNVHGIVNLSEIFL